MAAARMSITYIYRNTLTDEVVAERNEVVYRMLENKGIACYIVSHQDDNRAKELAALRMGFRTWREFQIDLLKKRLIAARQKVQHLENMIEMFTS